MDQFLEHLLAEGITKIIRVGGQSRSDLLGDHNLRFITKTEGKTRHEKWQVADSYEKLEEYEQKSHRVLGHLHGIGKKLEWKTFKQHLRRRYPRIYRQFDRTDKEGFEVVGRHPFEIWVTGGTRQVLDDAETSTEIINRANTDIHSLFFGHRRKIIDIWSQEMLQESSEEFFELSRDVKHIQTRLSNVYEEIDRRVLQEAEVVGMTTSGLAKNILALQHVKAKVVICEEAGEVMEPHVMSALLPSVEHFIQIGDHQQLRPSINNFKDLSLESKQGALYQLDRSQFERLSSGENGLLAMPVSQLNVQRRMRPAISSLIRETIYSRLIDHPSTLQLPDIVGMRKNVFWLDHVSAENEAQPEVSHQKSKSNDWEVEMVLALVRHVVRQGVYSSKDIAVLTPYTGQLQKLRRAMRNDFEIVLSDRDEDALARDGFDKQNGFDDDSQIKNENRRRPLQKKQLSELLRIATVDNFQGEEAKIIIVSLVRSNDKKKVGFLRTPNRINVLLSRAQQGMYLIGNSATYSNVPMWQQVIDMLRTRDYIGACLELCCPRHTETPIQIQYPDDFTRLSPEGGCREACTDRLPDCGHRCQARCHSKAMHEVFKCEKACQRRHAVCGHLCQKSTCGEDCGRCMVNLNDITLPCGHIKDKLQCYLTQHLETVACKFMVKKKVLRCNHEVQVRCHVDVSTERYQCPVPCDTLLPCGHMCPSTCGGCNTRNGDGTISTAHSKCKKLCGRRFGTCSHICSKRCHDGTDCGLCMAMCEVRCPRMLRNEVAHLSQVACKHSRCPLRCHEACAPCVEPCTWSCPHQGDCSLPCSAPCDRLPCNKRCTSRLACGHQCPSICGEDCLPEYCQECNMKPDAQVDMLEFKNYADIDIDATPVVALACGHFFTAETLDGELHDDC